MSGVVYTLVGVLVGFLLNIIREHWAEARTRNRTARYLAVRVVGVLDPYLMRCIEVVRDDGIETPDGQTITHVHTPGPPRLPEDVDWRSIDYDLMHRILTLPGEVEAAEADIDFISSEIASPPDYEEAFDARQEHYAELGLKVWSLTEEIRVAYGLPKRDLGGWNPIKIMRDKLTEIQGKRCKQTPEVEG